MFDVSVFLFDWDPQAMGGLGSLIAIGNFSSGGEVVIETNG
jgi:hypothetical protein